MLLVLIFLSVLPLLLPCVVLLLLGKGHSNSHVGDTCILAPQMMGRLYGTGRPPVPPPSAGSL